MYLCENGKMRPVETIPGMGKVGIKENDGGVNWTKVYCKHFCKCHSEPQHNNNIIKKRGGGRRRIIEGMNQTRVHCTHRWKCQTNPPVQLIYANKNIIK
jgi:hypothetical protein